LLSVEDATVDLPTPRGNLRAVDHVDLTVGAGRTLGVVASPVAARPCCRGRSCNCCRKKQNSPAA